MSTQQVLPDAKAPEKKIPLRRALRFIQAYFCLLTIHRTLEQGGFNAAREKVLRDWKARSRSLAIDHTTTRDIEWAVVQACAWQWKRSVCLHRALAAYALLRGAGAQPRFVMAISNRPFASHAWVEIDGQPVADAEMNDSRYLYKPVMSLPGK